MSQLSMSPHLMKVSNFHYIFHWWPRGQRIPRVTISRSRWILKNKNKYKKKKSPKLIRSSATPDLKFFFLYI